MKPYAFLPFLVLVLFPACAGFQDYDQSPKLLFKTGFQGTSLENGGPQQDRFYGQDPECGDLGSWADLEDGIHIGTCLINYEAGEPSQRRASIETDPTDPQNPVLEFRITEPHIVEGDHMKGRVSAILEGLSGVYGFSQTIRLRLDPSLTALGEWDRKVDWFTLFEFWCGDEDRLTVSLYKEEGAGAPIRWRFTKDRRELFTWRREWEAVATGDEVAFGKWINLGLSVRVGEEGEARAWLGREEDGSWLTLIETAKPIGKPSGFSKLNPFKLYTSGSLIEYLLDKDASLSVLWDDWSLWLNDGIAEAEAGTP